jgi:hypothetical protein
MLSVLLTWVLIGLVIASVGSRIADASGADLLRDMGFGAAGAIAGGIALMCVEMSAASALRPVGVVASLVGSIFALFGFRALAMARRRSQSGS